MHDSRGKCICEGQYREWLRAPLAKRGRKMEIAELGLRKRPEVSRFRMLGEVNQNEDRGVRMETKG